MRSIDLALHADELDARAANLAAQLERARSRLRQEAIERGARRALDEGSFARLESLGVLHRHDVGELRAEIGELSTSLPLWKSRRRGSRNGLPPLRKSARLPDRE
jgi:hypothetical protein